MCLVSFIPDCSSKCKKRRCLFSMQGMDISLLSIKWKINSVFLELKVETEIGDAGEVTIKMAVLGAYTWAILQFTLMTTATQKDRQQEQAETQTKNSRKISLSLGHYNKASHNFLTFGILYSFRDRSISMSQVGSKRIKTSRIRFTYPGAVWPGWLSGDHHKGPIII